jgi:ABC-type transporter Mla subunit MlaD
MTIFGTIALVALVILGVLVLRIKSDPMEKESVRKYFADREDAGGSLSHATQVKDTQEKNSTDTGLD